MGSQATNKLVATLRKTCSSLPAQTLSPSVVHMVCFIGTMRQSALTFGEALMNRGQQVGIDTDQ